MRSAHPIGPSGLPIAGTPRISPLAARLGLTEEDAAAARREAERAESRGDHARALDAWRLALLIEPAEVATWRGLARAARRLGRSDEAMQVERAADAVERVAQRTATERSGSWMA